MLFNLIATMQHDSLAPAVQQQLQAGGAEGALEHAAAIVGALPTSRPASASGLLWLKLLAFRAALLDALANWMIPQSSTDAQQAATAGSVGEPAQAASQAGAASEAAWQVARLLPQLATTVAALVKDVQDLTTYPNEPDLLLHLNQLCLSLEGLQAQPYALSLEQCSAQQIACWLEAVAASLRLAPSLAQLAACLEPAGNGMNWAADAYSDLMRLLQKELPRQLQQLVEASTSQCLSATAARAPDEAAARQGLPARLWGLHTSLCRLIAALTSSAAPLPRPSERLSASGWRALQLCTSALLVQTTDVHRLAQQTAASDAVHFAAEAPRQAGRCARK